MANPVNTCSSSIINFNQSEKPELAFFSRYSGNLSDLLPSKKEGPGKKKEEPRKALGQYYLLVKALQHTIEGIEQREYSKFDGLVRENLCQVRAVMVHLICRNCSENFLKIKERVEYIVKHILTELGTRFQNNQLGYKDLEISLSGSLLLLVKLYLLTVGKGQRGGNYLNLTEKIERAKLKALMPDFSGLISNTFIDSLTDDICKQVSEISAPFLRDLAFKSGDTAFVKCFRKQTLLL